MFQRKLKIYDIYEFMTENLLITFSSENKFPSGYSK